MLVTARLKYVAESERGSRRYLDVTLLGGQQRRMADLWGSRKVRKNLDGTPLASSSSIWLPSPVKLKSHAPPLATGPHPFQLLVRGRQNGTDTPKERPLIL